MSQSVLIQSNAASLSDIRVPDLGTDIPLGGGSLTVTDRNGLMDASVSVNLRTLSADNAFGAGQHSLILYDPANPIAPVDVDAFLANLPTIQGLALYELYGVGTNPGGDPGDYAGRFEGVSIGTGDISLNRWGYFYNTSTSKLFIVRNRGGVLYSVEQNV